MVYVVGHISARTDCNVKLLPSYSNLLERMQVFLNYFFFKLTFFFTFNINDSYFYNIVLPSRSVKVH